MHQGQRSSFPNCEVVQRGVKLLRLDCAAGGEWRKKQNGGVASGGKKRQRERYKWDDRGWGGLELRAEQRGGNTGPNLLPSGASTFHPIVFFSLFSTSFASHSPLPR